MPAPYDYRLRNAINPSQMLIDSLQMVNQVDTMKANREIMAEKRNAAALAAEQQKQLQLDLGMVGANPTTAGISKLMAKYPQLSEDFKRTYDVLDADEQKARIGQASQVYAALEANNPDMANRILMEQAEAYKNSGREKEGKTLLDLAELVKMSPETAKTSAGLFLASAMGSDKFVETFTKLQSERRAAEEQPAKLTEAQARARKAAIDADFAESQAAMDLEKKGWDIYKIQEDVAIAKENSRIAAINAQIGRETNELKKQELQQKLDDAKKKRDEDIRTKTAEVSNVRQGIDNSINTIDRLLKNPELDNILGSVEGRDFYPSTMIAMLVPGADADVRADAIADAETVQSQSFLNNLLEVKDKGATFGSLTEKEGERLTAYVTNLKTAQSEKQFKESMKEIQRLLLKSRQNLTVKYGVPDNIPDTPEAEASPEDVDAILRQYGVIK